MGETLRTRREILQGLTTAIAAASSVAAATDALGESRTPHAGRHPNIVFLLGEGIRAIMLAADRGFFRTERYELIPFISIPELSRPEEWELYDLASDPGENHDLHGKKGFAELTAQLRSRAPGAQAPQPKLIHFPDKPTAGAIVVRHDRCVEERLRRQNEPRAPAGK